MEKLLRFFVKKLLFLPNNTPNYMLFIETGLHSLYINTLRIHFAFICRCLSLEDCRFPKIAVDEVIRTNIYFVAEWRKLGTDCGVQIASNLTVQSLMNSLPMLLEKLKHSEMQRYLEDARSGSLHDLYPTLNFNIQSYFNDKLPAHAVGLILRARGGLLNLNGRAFKSNTDGICTICNLDKVENTYHFLGECPIFSNYRLKYFGKRLLSLEDVISLLNGPQYENIISYLKICLKYRDLIINEFA